MVGKSPLSSKAIPEKEVCIILPALNEAETVGLVIDEIPKECLRERGYGVEILVVDNNSTDATGQIAREKGARVIVEPMRGKGRAITTAFKSISGDFIFILDADYTYPATSIPEMLELLEGGYDVVLGSRLKGHMAKGAMTKFNLVGNYLLALLANILCGTRISDLCTGCWGFKGTVVKGLRLNATGFDIEANMFVQVAKKGYRVAEVPIHYRRRETLSRLSSLKDGLKIGRMLIRERFRQQ